MPGTDEFTMEPGQVRGAARLLFEIEEEADQIAAGVVGASVDVGSSFAGQHFALGAALESAAGWWRRDRVRGFGGRVGNVGELLAVCAEEAVDLDEFTAESFSQYADADRYPDR